MASSATAGMAMQVCVETLGTGQGQSGLMGAGDEEGSGCNCPGDW
jgi:hypothetical protein